LDNNSEGIAFIVGSVTSKIETMTRFMIVTRVLYCDWFSPSIENTFNLWDTRHLHNFQPVGTT